jgi:SAM-dependent methyltransferase
MTPDLIDRQALAQHRARAARIGPALFLLDEVIAEVQERLIEVNKSFTSVAIVTPWPEPWAKAFPQARIVPDDETLQLEPGAHDLVIHALCLHWANDPVGQLVQCRRALRPDGLLLASLFGGQTLHELRTALAEAETMVSGGLSPRVLPMAEIRDLGGLIQRAGLALPVADGYARRVMYRDIFHLMADLRAMGEQNALTPRLRRASPRALFAQAAATYHQAFADPDTGRVPATFEMLWLTGWAAHDSQQKPLRPGSAVTRLADALNTAETPLPAKD